MLRWLRWLRSCFDEMVDDYPVITGDDRGLQNRLIIEAAMDGDRAAFDKLSPAAQHYVMYHRKRNFGEDRDWRI